MSYDIKISPLLPPGTLKELSKIDQAVFPEELWGTQKNETSRYLKYPDEYVVLFKDKKPIGYIQYFPITNSFAGSLYRDEIIHDDDITAKDIGRFRRLRYTSVYILSVAIAPEHQGSEAMKVLGQAFSRLLVKKNARGYYIKDIFSTAVSDAGRRTLGIFGLMDVKTLKDGYSLYACSMGQFIKAAAHLFEGSL